MVKIMIFFEDSQFIIKFHEDQPRKELEEEINQLLLLYYMSVDNMLNYI